MVQGLEAAQRRSLLLYINHRAQYYPHLYPTILKALYKLRRSFCLVLVLGVGVVEMGVVLASMINSRKLEHDRPSTQKQRKKDNQQKSSYIHV